MPTEDWRPELEAHKADPFAHPQMASRFMLDHAEELVGMKADQGALNLRLTAVEKFAEQAKGGAVVLGALVGGGVLVLVGHLLGLPI